MYLNHRATSVVTLSSFMGNCSRDLFRDTYSLTITNFSEHDNGYYWCQLAIDNVLFAQPSHHVRLYVGQKNSISCPVIVFSEYSRPATSASEYQCANLTTRVPSITSLSIPSTPVPTVQPEKDSRGSIIIYIAGGLSTLIIVFGALIVALSVLYLCKFRNRQTSKPLVIIIYHLLLI